jgi:hypothetical protein
MNMLDTSKWGDYAVSPSMLQTACPCKHTCQRQQHQHARDLRHAALVSVCMVYDTFLQGMPMVVL